ncbi:Na+/H+ antiporter [soil metagenome]
MHPVEVTLLLMLVVAVLVFLAGRLRLPYPILLVIGGLGIGIVATILPGMPRFEVTPDLVFLLFLPPLLYYAGIQTSWRDFKFNLRAITLLAVGLVLLTTVIVAIVAHFLVGDVLPWPACFLLGAIVSPPDAIAATSVLQRISVPKRIVTILEGESLVNDATALVAFRFGIAAMTTGHFSLAFAGLEFLKLAAGGIVVGYFVGMIVAWLHPRIKDLAVESVIALLTPYAAYLPAEHLGVSGVLAAVTAGIYMSRQIPRVVSPESRMKLNAMYDTIVFFLNSFIFILIGLALPAVLEHLQEHSWPRLIATTLAICLTAIIVRLLWVFPAAYLPRKLFKYIRDREPYPTKDRVFLIGWISMRGIVSLAAALSIPAVLDGTNQPFPGRELIIFITFGVILLTLVGQGLTLPLVIRALGLTSDGNEEKEEIHARLSGARAALGKLEELARAGQADSVIIARLRVPYEERILHFGGAVSTMIEDQPRPAWDVHNRVQRQLIAAERSALIRLRDRGDIGDEVLRKIQDRLDLEEALLQG